MQFKWISIEDAINESATFNEQFEDELSNIQKQPLYELSMLRQTSKN